MRKMVKAKKRKAVLEIFCHYKGGWFPAGRSKKKCPYCGAQISEKGGMAHKFRKKRLVD